MEGKHASVKKGGKRTEGGGRDGGDGRGKRGTIMEAEGRTKERRDGFILWARKTAKILTILLNLRLLYPPFACKDQLCHEEVKLWCALLRRISASSVTIF